jgi:NarL family two-component system response regulator LiaR
MTETNPIRVMLVDDHAVVRSGLGAFLLAFDDLELVGEAGGGEEAVRLCEQLEPDVVLMDLVMPGMDGAAATRAIRERCPQIQVIALTSFKEKELVHKALEAGAIGYLLKNVSEGTTIARLRPDPPRAGGAGPDGRRAEQPRDRRAIGAQSLHRQVPRQQRSLQTGRHQPHRGGGAGPTTSPGHLTR